ncbi:patatin-like phospholipase family protein [Frigoriglobus tundricola]|uniref:Putative lipoprotein n=1 Tax=Frigoriglobus tundricola TaxID=2774151 RepID=A0A6M5YRA4_9BACT|nr:patatin-like phospholipase family protein [Frigoriglobus tundricola]QJW95960.1 putative lipoprotein [Frigoriglobus tundricola]
MVRTCLRPGPVVALGLVLVALVIGCASPGSIGERRAPLRHLMGREARSPEELRASIGWLDIEAQDAGRGTITSKDLIEFAEQARATRKPPVPFPRKSVLIVTGGGSYGAYPAGVLVGWTAAGTRPEFDVVTGISTGALLGAFAFLGASEDCELQRCYTTLRNEDIYRRNRFIPSLLSEAFADTAPLAKLIARTATDERIRRYALEHQKGRRFYVGTTDLDARRAVIWDMGAIAARDTPEDRDLFRKVLLASASIPGFFPPVRIPVTVDGKRHVERHIDGGTTSSMFFAPPWVPPEARAALPSGWLYGSDIYVLVAGKMYPDPAPVKPRAIAIASSAVSTVIYDQTRSDLHKVFLLSTVTGMNYNVAVIPRDLDSPLASTDFDPVEMTRLFNAGAEWARSGPKWRITPPGYESGEGVKFRAGTVLTDTGRGAPRGELGPPKWPLPATVPPEK